MARKKPSGKASGLFNRPGGGLLDRLAKFLDSPAGQALFAKLLEMLLGGGVKLTAAERRAVRKLIDQ